ncbi:hypothetical protein BVG16_01390 [Paenibacillus selenitireducens]|uniref:Uncharacterized protein n=1 Tax=Paenibacillus selenitireducens TaxID=1324314 RepID=A0A1T2XMD3_9BACL|nr:tetratricopeptide repeat protein [Paenibacillus selenitireducens]OPA81027.1 hypothetical protein BVG16_01390 [Paenibacillus selenitireducens]
MRDFDQLWDYHHPNETEQRFNRLLAEVEHVQDPCYIAELLTQIARTQGLQMKFSEAHDTLNRVETLLTEDMPAAKIRYFLERGRVYNSSSQQAAAIPYFLQAWELGVQTGEEDYAVDAAHMLGIAEATPEQRMAWNLKALALAERSLKANRWLGSLYNNIGWAQVDAGNLDEALNLFERAFEFRKSQGKPEPIFIAKWSIAKVLRLMHRTQESLEIQMDLLRESEQIANPDGYVNEEIGECLLLLHRNMEAQPYFSRAYELLSLDSWLIKNEPDRMVRLKELAGLS